MFAFIITSVFCQTPKLFYESFTNSYFDTSDIWIIQNNDGIYSDCGGTRILGGYNNFGSSASAMLFFQLPPHYQIEFKFQLWIIDNWAFHYFFIFLDQAQCYANSFKNILNNSICGLTGFQDQTINIPPIITTHNFDSVVIFLSSTLDEPSNKQSWGFNNFQFYLYLCPPGCSLCQQGEKVYECLPWLNIGSAFSSRSIYQFDYDGWLIDNISQQTSMCGIFQLFGGYGITGKDNVITKTYNLPPHYMLKIKFRIIFIDTWDGEFIYLSIGQDLIYQQEYSFDQNFVQQFCGDIYSEQISDVEITLPHSENTIELIFTNNLDEDSSNESFGIMDFELFIYVQPQCGNGIIEYPEECDDGNLFPFDGCFSCQLKCGDGCQFCMEKLCLE